MHRVARQIYHAIQAANHIILIPHPKPDGDALGSVSAMTRYLRRIEKNHTAFCATTISPRLAFIPHAAEIATADSVWTELNPDVVMVFDSGDLRYAGIADHLKQLPHPPVIINIDHHATNELYGHHNLVLPTASSTTEVLYNFFKYNQIKIDAAMATCLLTGLITDTDNFTNAATSSRALSIAGDLIRRGGDLGLIQESVFKDKSMNALRLWGLSLSRLTTDNETGVVHTYLTQADWKKYAVSDIETEGIANFMNNLDEAPAALILKELGDGKVKGSLRTTRNDVNVSAWAKALGGGGHKKAAGFTVTGSIDSALKKVFAEIGAMSIKDKEMRNEK